MLAVQTRTFYFDAPGSLSQTFSFTNTIQDFGAALQGFELTYGEDDHEIQTAQSSITNVSLSTDQTQVTVEATLRLNDNDGAAESTSIGKGLIDVVVFADLKT